MAVTPSFCLSQAVAPGVLGHVGSSRDSALVAALRAGDAAAFTAAYTRFRAPLYSFLRRGARRDEQAHPPPRAQQDGEQGVLG